jgi:hypothetical protein
MGSDPETTSFRIHMSKTWIDIKLEHNTMVLNDRETIKWTRRFQ